MRHARNKKQALDCYCVLTISLLFPAEPEPDEFVSEAAAEVLGRPLESRPVAAHAGEDSRLLQVTQDLLDLIRIERFAARAVGSHRP